MTKRMYELELSQFKEVARGHHAPINWIEIDRVEKKYLLSAGADSQIHIYDIEEPVHTKLWKIPSIARVEKKNRQKFGVSSVAWYPFDTGMFISSSFDNTVNVWDTNTMTPACTFDLEEKVFSQAISPIAYHSLVAGASADPRVRLCDLRSGAFTHSLTGHNGSVMAVQWSTRYEHMLVTGGTDCTIRVWDIRKAAACIMSLDQYNTEDADPLSSTNQAHNRPINGLAFSSDGLHIISLGMDEKIRLWDAYTGQNTLVNYGPHLRNRSRTTIKPLIVDNGIWPPLIFIPSDDHQVLAFDMLDGSLVKRLRGSYGRVTSVDKRPGREELYSASKDQEILVWEAPRKDSELIDRRPEAEMDAWSSDEDE
ncbi:hypothetical protein K450DRAFT_258644 [Umbelopsis ramanniana AG]|uniref:WD40 repeat-like protein n=1 Tax=Umbelopsis ramanniana AG TaxID=1314678 RepID=A0AAD5E484_UMBRA|nr:uncharacterized protein K450DRAFT_258644 [Umbelopsis ramanniana AG]KAI8576050.1 hypothetical protein K450DRAFT_258644 [Umbelopsis ramanniana AG]